MSRPRTVDNESVLSAALALMHERGPAALTFAALAKSTGLAPATLVQRFGTKEGMVEAGLLHAWDRLDARTAVADADAPATPEGAVALLVALSNFGDRERFGDGLLILREDFQNPRLRERGNRWGDGLICSLGRRLTADSDKQRSLGRLMANQWQGALVWWGFSSHREIEAVVVAELRAFLQLLGEKV